MKPDYQGDKWAVYLADCIEVMNGLQPSHDIRKLTIVLPAHVVDALRSKLRGDETITDCIKRLVVREAMGVGGVE